MQPLIELSHVSGGYEGKKVLYDISLRIFERDFLGIVGPNGGGKTTLVKIIMGLLKPQSGSITFCLNGEKENGISMGYLPQCSSIDRKFPISVYDVILSGLGGKKSVFRRFSSEQHEQVRHTISRMGLEGLERHAIGKLSGGQLQRVLLGRALVSSPKVLILDEPNAYIDRRFEAKLYPLLEEVNRECAVILVSHDMTAVLRHTKSVAYVNGTLHYYPETGKLTPEKLEENLTGVL